MIKTYIRNENGTPRGVVVAFKDEDGLRFGWSLCNPRDHFNKKLGTEIAVRRAGQDRHPLPAVRERNRAVGFHLARLAERAKKYFK